MRQQFHNMNNQPGREGSSSNPNSQSRQWRDSGQNSQRPTANGQSNTPNSSTSKVGEYIDFEEIK
jgi:hypothetical protein